VRHPVRDAFEKQIVVDLCYGHRGIDQPVVLCGNLYDATIWIAQKSLAKCAPLMGESFELALEPVRYS